MVDVEYLGLIIAVAVVLVGAVVGLVATRGRGRRTPTLDRKGPPEVVAPADTEAEAEPGVGDDAAVPRDTPTRTVEDAELPTVEAPPPVEMWPNAVSSKPRVRTAAAESPPPTTVKPLESTRAWATALVPSA